MSNLIAAILSVWIVFTGAVGEHVAFPYVAEVSGEAMYLFRTGDAHNGSESNVRITTGEGALVYEFQREDFGGVALYPGGLSQIDGKVYALLTLTDWSKATAFFPATSRARAMVSEDMQNWQSLGIPNYGVCQFAHGNPFRLGDNIFFQTYAIDSAGRWLGLLWRYYLPAGTWHLRSKFTPPAGLRYGEMAIARISDTEWLAATRTKVDEAAYNGEWLTFFRSTNQGGRWTLEPQTVPINAADMVYHDGYVKLVGRGCGGSCYYRSEDGGRTWPAPLALDPGLWQYGDNGMAGIGVVNGAAIATWYGTLPDGRMFIKAAEVE